jgi:hypothetical protein
MNHLIKAVEIIKELYKGEIYGECSFDADDEDSYNYPQGAWSYNFLNWTVQIDTNDMITYNVVAYRAKDNVTNWSDYVVLPSYAVQWELT